MRNNIGLIFAIAQKIVEADEFVLKTKRGWRHAFF
jgi:hypothetical protein